MLLKRLISMKNGLSLYQNHHFLSIRDGDADDVGKTLRRFGFGHGRQVKREECFVPVDVSSLILESRPSRVQDGLIRRQGGDLGTGLEL